MRNFLLLFLVFVLLFTTGCGPATGSTVPTPSSKTGSSGLSTIPSTSKTNLAIGGIISSELYSSLVGSSAPTIEFVLKLTIENIGETITFDEFVGGFHPNQNKIYPVVVRPGSATTFQLKQGAKMTYSFATNGHTYEMLALVGKEPMFFSITFNRAGSAVAGPYYAVFPELSRLSDDGKVNLVFSTNRP